jgi:hypothetical protein
MSRQNIINILTLNMIRMEFKDPDVLQVFDNYPEKVRAKLMFLRSMIFDTAEKIEGVGKLHETLKWGEPSYLTPETKSGSTVRINWKEPMGNSYAIYFKCTTSLVLRFKELYPDHEHRITEILSLKHTGSVMMRLNETIITIGLLLSILDPIFSKGSIPYPFQYPET